MYGRRRGRAFGRRRSGIAKRAVWRKPTATNQRRQIYGLAKSVGRLQSRWTAMSVKHMYSESAKLNLYSSDASGQGYLAMPLTNCVSWDNVFNTSAGLYAPQFKTQWMKMQMAIRFQIKDQPAPVVYHMYVVSLKRAAGTLNINGLTLGDHYETAAVDPDSPNPQLPMVNVMLNPKCFTIHKYRKFTLAAKPESDPTPQARNDFPPTSWKDVRCTLYPRKMIRSYDGQWDKLQSLDLPPTSRYYLLIFFNNSYASQYYNVAQVNVMHSVKNMA